MRSQIISAIPIGMQTHQSINQQPGTLRDNNSTSTNNHHLIPSLPQYDPRSTTLPHTIARPAHTKFGTAHTHEGVTATMAIVDPKTDSP